MDGPAPAEVWRFEGFRFDRVEACLLRDSGPGVTEPLPLGGRAAALLTLLLERQGKLVAKDEIFAAVWPGIAVEEANLTVQISALRRILDRDRDRGSCIQTVPGRGYRFVAPVTQATPAPPRTLTPPGPALAVPDKPSIAVLPFANLSGDPDQEYFADGMVEEIITALGRIRWLFVIASNSSFTYKGQVIDIKQVGCELGVRYVLEGSVRKARHRVRVTGQLVDAVTGAHLWTDRFDGAIDDIFELQEKVASSVAGVIEPALQAAEATRSSDRPTSDLTAYDLYLRAYAMFLSSARQIPEALRLMEQAIERDPRYGPALAWAALCCYRLVLDGRSQDPATDRRKGTDFARRALEGAGDDAGIRANAAVALAYFGADIGTMMALIDRALAQNPSWARGWSVSAMRRLWAGQLDIAIEHAETALRLSPRARVGSPLLAIGAAHFFSRRFDEAVPELLLAIQDDPGFPEPYRFLAACYAQMGRLDDAREIIEQLRSITSLLVPEASYLRNPEHREFYLSGLRLAIGFDPALGDRL